MTRSKHLLLAVASALAGGILTAAASSAPNAGGLPLYFERQPASGDFVAHTLDGQMQISGGEIEIPVRGHAPVRMRVAGGNPGAQVTGQAELAGRVNYLMGRDPSQWRTGVDTFSKIRVENLYPGINAVYYGNQKQLEYDFQVQPGANPAEIVLDFQGADSLSIDAKGDLVLKVGGHEICQHAPVIYQSAGGERRSVSGGYRLTDAHTVGFVVGDYDHTLPLVIDPFVSYSSYLGGNLGERGYGVAVDANGFVYVSGSTLATKMGTAGAFQTQMAGGVEYGDAYVAKFDHTGTNLIYFTYVGGTYEDEATGIAVDSLGEACICGITDSPNFPVTPNALRPTIGTRVAGGLHNFTGFVAKLNASGTGLVYSTYLGGNLQDAAYAVAVDQAGNAYITGYTSSDNFPATNYIQHYLACTNTYFNCNAFLTAISADGGSFLYSTYYGGNNVDVGTSLAVDASSNVYVAGYTTSVNFPTRHAFQPLWNNTIYPYTLDSDAFVLKVDGTGTNVIYSSFLGGIYSDYANAIAVDSKGAAYVAGWTTSTNFENTTETVDIFGLHIFHFIHNFTTNNTAGTLVTTNVFLTKIIDDGIASSNPTPARIAYSVVFGGFFADEANGVAVDQKGNAYVTGATSSFDYPTANTSALLRALDAGFYDAFVTVVNSNCTGLLYSGFIGGFGNDYGNAIAVDANQTAYIAGTTASDNFDVTAGVTNFPVYKARDRTLKGGYDAFLTIIPYAFPTAHLSIEAVTTNDPPHKPVTTGFKLSWPYNATLEPRMAAFYLEGSTNLAKTNWTKITTTPTLKTNMRSVTIPITSEYHYFRLATNKP